MNNLEFSFNCNNKLHGSYFTTLRINGKHNVGDKVNVYLKRNYLGVAQIVDKRRLTNIEAIDEFIAGVDTGYSADETIKLIMDMYKTYNINWNTQPIYLYLVRFIQKMPKSLHDEKQPTNGDTEAQKQLFPSTVSGDEFKGA